MTSPTASLSYEQRYPRLRLIAYFAAWKTLLLCIAVLSPGPGYDTSTTLSQSSDMLPYFHENSSSVLEFLIGKLVRWDAIYFTQIARRGYLYEQEWAFGWGHTRTLAFISQSKWPLEVVI